MEFTSIKLNLVEGQLDPQRIDIWQFSLKEAHFDCESLLSPDEHERKNRYYFKKHQRRFLIARASLRRILSAYLNCDPKNLIFHYSKEGKPYLQSKQDIHFNLSHSGDLAQCAIGCHNPLGIDLEAFSERPYSGIASMMFSKEENLMLNRMHYTLKPATFFHIWSQKEAFIKAVGLGLFYPTQDFSVDILAKEPYLIKDNQKGQSWCIQSFMPHIAYWSALCYHPLVQQFRFFNFKP